MYFKNYETYLRETDNTENHLCGSVKSYLLNTSLSPSKTFT